MRRQSSFLLLVLLTLSVQADSPVEPAAQLAQVLNSIEGLYARYEQQSSAPDTQTGEFWLKKPGYFRIESGPPLSQTVISDGKTLWTHDRDLEQVIISDVDSSSGEIPLLLFAGDPAAIARQYEIEAFEDETRQHFLLRPRDDASLIRVLALSFEDDRPIQIQVETSMQERTAITLHDQAALDAGDESLFEFEAPDFVDVIDDRSVNTNPEAVDTSKQDHVTLP